MMRRAVMAVMAATGVLTLSAGIPAVQALTPVKAAKAGPGIHPVSGLRVIPLTIRSGARVQRFRVELAGTEEEQARGLMFRKTMGANEGMIFPMKPPRLATFWMHNTVLPLDLIFVGTNGRVMTIAARAVPYSDAQIPSGGVASAVLELNGGRAAELGIKVGDKVAW